MKYSASLLISILLISGCSTQKELAYLDNLPEAGGQETFIVDIPDYLLQYRDILYVTIKAMTPEGMIADFLSPSRTTANVSNIQNEAGQYLYGYDVNSEGFITIPVLGHIKVEGLTLEQAKKEIQVAADRHFNDATVECKLLSFKFTVIGEVKTPGTFINYNNYLTVLEAIGRAGGIGDYGNRDRVLVVRAEDKGSKTFRLNLQDKAILNSEAYFLLPNDVVIVEPMSHKLFNMNLPTFAFIITTITSTITTTLLLIDYFK